MYLKNNTIPTIITTINERVVVAGTMSTGILFNFIKDPSTNSLKYTGPGARFHIITNFSFSGGGRDIYGFYIGRNTNPSSPLDPNADRISESEIYVNSNQANDQPAAGAIQTVLDLNTDDRVFFIVQNRETTADITVEFMKFVVSSITAEKGPQGNTGPSGESTVVLLTDGASIATDSSLGNVFYVTLGGNRTLSNPTNPTSGKRIIWRIKQDATGGRTITLDNKFRLGTDITSVVLSTAPSITDYIGAIYNAQDDKWDVIAFVKGFA